MRVQPKQVGLSQRARNAVQSTHASRVCTLCHVRPPLTLLTRIASISTISKRAAASASSRAARPRAGI